MKVSLGTGVETAFVGILSPPLNILTIALAVACTLPKTPRKTYSVFR